ncbi:ROK family protein [Nocardioides sp.]|uniref:ROK family protein n=1 Tax=Nocardioides sp. TaxID=35761 RepID=UPI001A2C83CF|nr:ROK family protein [Nocardioides sp.]MBJ7356663.1 ROK family protein [Nocardioides sp.]
MTANGPGLIGLDIGATKTLGVLVDPDGHVQAQELQATAPGAAGVIDTAARVVADLGGGAAAGSVGVGIPGLVDHVGGEVQHAVNLGLNGDRLSLRALLEERCSLPVHVENDVNAATLGAVALSGIQDLVYLSIGTGLAAGIAIDGRVRRGATGAAGEVGHVPVDPAGALCRCGQRGCLETVASGSALAAAWPSGDRPAAQALFAAAAAGDPAAIAVRDRFSAGVADAVRTLALSVDPQTVVLGGGVAHLGQVLVDHVAEALRRQAASSPFLASLDLAARLRVVPEGQPVAAIGAALLGRP